MTDTLKNKDGSTYVVISAFGWAMDKNLFRAFAKLAESSQVTGNFASGKDLKQNGKAIEAADDSIFVYYVPDESKLVDFCFYKPRDEEGNTCGVLIYGGEDNADLVKGKLMQSCFDLA